MPPNSRDPTRDGYDRVAGEYTERIANELEHKPFDRDVLTRFAARLAGRGPVVDIGCGPGQVAAFLASKGVDARGVDLSPGMLERARALHPGLHFEVGDMRALDFEDGSLAGISAFYSIIHIPRDGILPVLREFHRVLEPGGLLLLTFHLGSQIDHLSEWWGHEVSIDFVYFERQEMETKLLRAGFDLVEVQERDPYPDVESQTRRAYVLAARV